jgi:hypothetical protein
MKKIDKAGQTRNVASKLKLSRETLRRLNASELENVIGGTFITCDAAETCQASKAECETKNMEP